MFELDSLNEVIHVDKVAPDVGFCSVVSINQLLLLCREEISKNLDFIDRKSTLACLIQLWSLQMSANELTQVESLQDLHDVRNAALLACHG